MQISVTVQDGTDGRVKDAVESALASCGFTIVQDKTADYTALVSAKAEVQQDERAFISYPTASVEVHHRAEAVASYTTQSGKAAGFDEASAERAAWGMLAKDIEGNFLK